MRAGLTSDAIGTSRADLPKTERVNGDRKVLASEPERNLRTRVAREGMVASEARTCDMMTDGEDEVSKADDDSDSDGGHTMDVAELGGARNGSPDRSDVVKGTAVETKGGRSEEARES